MPNYSGMWTLQAQMQAAGQRTWPNLPINPGLWAWGTGNTGALGQNNEVNYSSPVQVGADTTWTKVSSSGYTTHSIKSNGTIWSWGANNRGQLGQNDRVSRSSPVQIGALTNWSLVSTGNIGGNATTAAIKTDGTLWSWGYNVQGQLGQNNTTYRSSPVQIGALTDWAKIYSGRATFLAIKTDGTLWSWGLNGDGQLGQNNTIYRSSPVQVGALNTWAVSAAGAWGSSYAIKTDGTLWSWGYNLNGELGQNNTTTRSSPIQVGALTTWSKVAAGNSYAIATRTDGTIWSWGTNLRGQLGQNDTIYRSSPVQVGALNTWSYVFLGASYISASIKSDGTLWIWGENDLGQLGLGDTTSRSSPVQVGDANNWAKSDNSVTTGTNSTLAIAT